MNQELTSTQSPHFLRDTPTPSRSFTSTPHRSSSALGKMPALVPSSSRTSIVAPGEACLEAAAFVSPMLEEEEIDGRDSKDEKSRGEVDESPVQDVSEMTFPDGGLRAWLVVLGGFWTVFCGFGICSGIGAFQTIYEQDILPTYSSSQIAWITSGQAFVTFASACFTGPLFDRFGHRPLIVVGGFCLTLGFCMLSLCTQYYQLLLCHITLIAMGCNFLFICPVGVVGQWFTKKRGLAFGLMSCGSSVGAVIWPIVLANLPPLIGFGWTCRVMALIAAFCSVLAFFLLKTRLPPRPPGPFFYFQAFKSLQYDCIVIYFFMLSFGFFCFLTFIGTYGHLRGLGEFAPYLLYVKTLIIADVSVICNAASSIGRLGSGILADRIGLYNTALVGGLCLTALSWIWIACESQTSLIILSILFGIAAGNFVALQPPIATVTATDMRYGATMIGQALFLQSFGQLVCSPLFGALIGKGTTEEQLRGFTHAIALGGALMVVALVALSIARVKTSRKVLIKL